MVFVGFGFIDRLNTSFRERETWIGTKNGGRFVSGCNGKGLYADSNSFVALSIVGFTVGDYLTGNAFFFRIFADRTLFRTTERQIFAIKKRKFFNIDYAFGNDETL